MAKYPSEIFGFYWENNSREAKISREKYLCPFHSSKCYKQSRLIDIPFGVCTVHYDGNELALCPRRFLEKNIIFKDIAIQNFGTTNNILVFSEVGLKDIGNFDFVMIKHTPIVFSIEDFVVIEFQTGQTTSTGKLVDGFNDFMKTKNILDGVTYGFGINFYDIWKRTFTQILNKGIIFEKWKKKIFWIVQDQIFEYFQKKYRLNELSFSKNHSTVFSLYDLIKSEDNLVLKSTRNFSSSIDDLFTAFSRNEDIPPVEEFLNRLENKIKKDVKRGLRIDKASDSLYIDAPRPSSTGRVREDSVIKVEEKK